MNSKWWADRPDAGEDLERREARCANLRDSLGDATFRVHYDDYVGDPSTLRDLFVWLGEPFDEDRVRAVLARPHSY